MPQTIPDGWTVQEVWHAEKRWLISYLGDGQWLLRPWGQVGATEHDTLDEAFAEASRREALRAT